MPSLVIAHYKDAQGVQHDVVVRNPHLGTWEVVDISAPKTTMIEILTGNEGRPEAEAIAREYLREKRAAGEKAAAGSRA